MRANSAVKRWMWRVHASQFCRECKVTHMHRIFIHMPAHRALHSSVSFTYEMLSGSPLAIGRRVRMTREGGACSASQLGSQSWLKSVAPPSGGRKGEVRCGGRRHQVGCRRRRAVGKGR